MWERKGTTVIMDPVPPTAVHYHIFIYSSGCAIECYSDHVTSQRHIPTAHFASNFVFQKLGCQQNPAISLFQSLARRLLCAFWGHVGIWTEACRGTNRSYWETVFSWEGQLCQLYTAVLTIRSASQTIEHSDEWNKPAVEGTAR